MSQVERIDSLFADETPEEKEIAKKQSLIHEK
jgi:hypothetical protein